jgi:hypothetical protein
VLLDSAGVIKECEEVDALCLMGDSGEICWRNIRRYGDDVKRAAARLGATVGVDSEALEIVTDDDAFAVTFEGGRVTRWASEAAFNAGLAVEPTLAEWLPEWDELGDRQRTALIAEMRALLKPGPACDAGFEEDENVRIARDGAVDVLSTPSPRGPNRVVCRIPPDRLSRTIERVSQGRFWVDGMVATARYGVRKPFREAYPVDGAPRVGGGSGSGENVLHRIECLTTGFGRVVDERSPQSAIDETHCTPAHCARFGRTAGADRCEPAVRGVQYRSCEREPRD